MKSYVFLAAVAVLLSATPAKADKVLATVNGAPITQADVDAFYNTSPAKAQGLPKEIIQAAIVDQLISMKLIDDRISKTDMANNPDIQARIEEARTQVLRDSWLEEQIGGFMTDEVLRAEYNKFVQELGGEFEVKASHILVDTEEQAKEVITELEKGANFSALAREKSIGPSGKDGGSLGYFTKGAMVPAFSEAAFATEVGTFTKQPVQTQFGWHVILVEDKRKIDPPAFDDIKDRIKAEAAKEAISKVVEDLQAGATIERFDATGKKQEPATPSVDIAE